MSRNTTNEISSDGRAGKEGRSLTQSANGFFHKPSGIFLICLLLFGLTVWVFTPVLQCDFQLFDESAELLRNTHVHNGLGWSNCIWALFSMEYSNWYPLTWISHMLDFAIYGERPWGHHLTNLILHAANGVLLFLVLKRMTGALWRSLIVAALFALHPLRVESVAWITERKDVLSALFGLLALWTYVRFTEESKVQGGRLKLFYGLTLLLFVFSLMSKSMLVTFPCLLLLLDFWPLERWRLKSKWGLVLEKVPFFLLIAPVSVVTYVAQKSGGMFMLQFPLSFRIETAFMGYARYLGKMFWPANFSVLYPYPDYWPVGQLLCASVMIMGISILAFALRQQRSYLLMGWLWYLGTLVPVIGLIPLGAQSMSNRYTYIPMIGMLLLVVWAMNDLSKRWRRQTILMTAALALILGVCILRTRAEIVYWKDGATLWSRAVAVTKNNFMAHYCLGQILSWTKPDEALPEYQTSVDIYPDYAAAQRELGHLLFDGDRFSDAIVHFQKAAQLDPQSSWTYHDLGVSFLKMGRVSEAVPFFMKAIEAEPQYAGEKDDLGVILFSGNYGKDAVSSFLAMARSDPTGFAHFLDAVQFDTNHIALISNMAWSFATNPDPGLRNGKYAVRLATRACEMTGYQTNFCVGALAVAYAEASRFDEAISNAQLACSLTSAVGQEQQLKQYQTLLEMFRFHQPYHEPIKPSSR